MPHSRGRQSQFSYKTVRGRLESENDGFFVDSQIIDNDDEKSKTFNYIFGEIRHDERCILGLDIYKYSKMDLPKQNVVPFLFDLLYEQTKNWCQQYDSVIFGSYNFSDHYISTGDGCFQVFDNPFQAICFNIQFYTVLRLYNSLHYYPNIGNYVGELTIRSTMTLDRVFQYVNPSNVKNWYGPGIIKCARIIAKDKLNRFLVDSNVFKYFLTKINGIESIASVDSAKIYAILGIAQPYSLAKSFLFGQAVENSNTIKPIKNCHVQKIADIKVKEADFQIYNVEIQRIAFINDPSAPTHAFNSIISIGSLNPTGLGEDGS